MHLYLEGETTALHTMSGEPIALGAGRAVLQEKPGPALSILTPSGEVAVTGTGAFLRSAAARSVLSGGGFLVALVRSYMPWAIDLVRVQVDGSAATVAAYQVGTPTQNTFFQDCRLEPRGAMQCFVDLGTFHNAIERFTSSTAPEVVYDENGKTVQIHISYLVTGP
jgi:hypothetical protein